MESAGSYMLRCLELAGKGKGLVAPNPMVGAVLVYEERIIGEGWHRQYGQAHAEVNCLESVREEDRYLIPESTMYVSLEPCAHQGKTPPCATRLVQEKIKKVVVCNDDPFEKVQGRGYDILKAGGIEVQTGLLKNEGRWLNRRFFCFHHQQRPYIILKWAQTSQGLFAPADRSRIQMSNKASRQLTHRWRTEEAAMLVGTTTAMNDDPRLTARLWTGKQPLRIVIDKDLKLPHSLRLFDDEAATWIVNRQQETRHAQLSYIRLNFENNVIIQLLQRLHTENIQSLTVEGGATLLNSFISAGIWDEARIFITPDIIRAGIPAPLLSNAQHIFHTQIDTDRLQVYTNRQNPYSHPEGMEL